MNNFLKVLILGMFCLYSADIFADNINSQIDSMDIDEIVVEDDPFIGVTIELEKFQPMVYMSNFKKGLYGSLYVYNINRLVTTLAESKEFKKDSFKRGKKKVHFLKPSKKFTIVQVLKSAVYKDNIPEEFTTYILKDKEGKLFAIPELTLKEVSGKMLTPFETNLLIDFDNFDKKSQVSIYFQKPSIYAHKKAPYAKKELDSVFDFFLSNLNGYTYENVKKSTRTFRMTMKVGIDALAYMISEFENLYIEDIEVISE